MKKFLTIVACFALVAAVSCSKKAAVEDYASVAFLIGDVQKNGSALAIGDAITESDVIQTGNQSTCDVKIGESIIRVKEKSKVVFSSLVKKGGMESTTLGLDSGKMLCKPKKLLKDDSFTVKTPTAVAGVRGTQFTIEADANRTTRVKVYDGKVKVAKRVPQLESQTERVLEAAPVIDEKQKIVITEQQVQAATKKVEQELQGKTVDQLTDAQMTAVTAQAVVAQTDIKAFRADDMQRDASELIAVEAKPVEVINKIKQEIKKAPAPDGRLLVTRFEVYFIKDGKVSWEGKVGNPPIKQANMLYIASGEYVFCASEDGPVLWKQKIEQNGEPVAIEKITIEGNKITAHFAGKVKVYDLKTGREL